MNREDFTLGDALACIVPSYPGNAARGICLLVEDAMRAEAGRDVSGAEWDELDKAMASWPKFSGIKSFPVPGTNGDSPGYTFSKALSGSLWDKSTEYGRLRWGLYEYLLTYFNGEDE